MPKLKILAIDPGTKFMGTAFLDGGKLIYCDVKVIKRGKTPHETLRAGREIILRLINDFKPDILAVEKTFFANNRNAALLNVFFDEIKGIGKRKRLKIACYSPNTIKKFICGNGRAGKAEVAKVIVAKYPELKVFLTQDRLWKERYHQNMFDAIGLGVMVEELSSKIIRGK